MVERDPQKLLAAYRSGLGPARVTEDRMLASLRSQIAAVPEPSGGGAAGGGAGASTVAKLATLVLAGSIGVAAVIAVLGRDAEPPTPTPVTQLEPQRAEPPSPSVQPPAPLQPSIRLEATVPAEPQPPTEAKTPQPRSAARRPARVDEPEPAPSLADEAKLLRSVDVALRERDFTSARERLDAYRQTFATGSLRAQADELALLLACAEDPDAESKRASEHLEAHPNSRARARIEDACGLR
jgi:hypothetical protein